MPLTNLLKQKLPSITEGLLSFDPHRTDRSAIAASGGVPIPITITIYCVEDHTEHVKGLSPNSRGGPVAAIPAVIIEMVFPIVACGRHEYPASVRTCHKYAVHAILLNTPYGAIVPQFILLFLRGHAP